MTQDDIPKVNSINLTPPDKKEITWQDNINTIISRTIDKEVENIMLPIYRYANLLNLMEYPLGCIIHEN